ncbi:hypothetical protein BGZ96_002624 [Linnemannia gamsii]|uniref:FAD-binding domain-containing protein n=1 Tax=Linnemannia gamsii TaxID=64522 RepID=A0ABQ7K963_9FUNG|nr:hypothetical protein BGZ96_002624 [Linnemannia gamsii]
MPDTINVDTNPKPTVIIVGAGLGGLLLGALLERVDIPYIILERASSFKPLGSAMSLGGQILPVFAQLGIAEKYQTMAKPYTFSRGISETGESLLKLDYSVAQDVCGYSNYIVARPQLYDLLLTQVPAHKILLGKRVLTIGEDDERIKVQTSDNSVYEGDILVGADGAYSAVRQRLYETLKQEDRLPKSDYEDLPFNCTCLVGQTEPLDLEEFPQLKDTGYPFIFTLGGEGRPYTWTNFSTIDGRIAWVVFEHLNKTTSRAAQEQRFRHSENSEWGPYAAMSMCDETRDFPIHYFGKDGANLTMGYLYDRTPQNRISKVMLEEKIFKTWHHGRTVLLGDGAVTAMHDAIVLANQIYALPVNTSKAIHKAFTEYQTERYLPAIEASRNSVLLSMILNKGFKGMLALFVSQHIPDWLWRIFVRRMVHTRPAFGALPKQEFKETVSPFVSASEEKAKRIFELRRDKASAAAGAEVVVDTSGGVSASAI